MKIQIWKDFSAWEIAVYMKEKLMGKNWRRWEVTYKISLMSMSLSNFA